MSSTTIATRAIRPVGRNLARKVSGRSSSAARERVLGAAGGRAVAGRFGRLAGCEAARRARRAASAATMPRGSAADAGRLRCFGRAFGFGFATALGFEAFDLAGAFGPEGFGAGLRAGDGLAAARAEARRLPAAVDAR